MTPDHLHLVDRPGQLSEVVLVWDKLFEKGLETPMIDTGLSATQTYERIKALMGDVDLLPSNVLERNMEYLQFASFFAFWT